MGSFPMFHPRFAGKYDPQSRDLTQLSSGYNFVVKPATLITLVRHVGCTIEIKWLRNIQNGLWKCLCFSWIWTFSVENNRFTNSALQPLYLQRKTFDFNLTLIVFSFFNVERLNEIQVITNRKMDKSLYYFSIRFFRNTIYIYCDNFVVMEEWFFINCHILAILYKLKMILKYLNCEF